MTELQTILGTDIPITTRGILYLCRFKNLKLTVLSEGIFDSGFDALNYYANIPNPESQLVTGRTYDELIINLHKLHKNITNIDWLESLANTL